MTQTKRKRKIRLSNQTKSGGNPMEKIVWSVWSCETPHKPSKIQRTCTFFQVLQYFQFVDLLPYFRP